LCLAAGDTPRLAYRLLSDIVQKEMIDCSGLTFIGLDEWIGIPSDNPGSCSHFLHTHLFGPLGIKHSQVRLFDVTQPDLVRECTSMNEYVRSKGIDMMVVGVGMNGHIGFNEPGVREDLEAHVADLDDTTRAVGQKYFSTHTTLSKGITLGLRQMLQSRRVILMASGQKKAPIIRSALQGDISTDVPASLIRKHPNGRTILDEDAASLLTII